MKMRSEELADQILEVLRNKDKTLEEKVEAIRQYRRETNSMGGGYDYINGDAVFYNELPLYNQSRKAWLDLERLPKQWAEERSEMLADQVLGVLHGKDKTLEEKVEAIKEYKDKIYGMPGYERISTEDGTILKGMLPLYKRDREAWMDLERLPKQLREKQRQEQLEVGYKEEGEAMGLSKADYFLLQAVNVKEIQKALDMGANIDAQWKDGTTALMRATTMEEIEFLVKAGANVFAKDEKGMTALVREVNRFYKPEGERKELLGGKGLRGVKNRIDAARKQLKDRREARKFARQATRALARGVVEGIKSAAREQRKAERAQNRAKERE